MSDTLSIALSGLIAQQQRFAASASNIANAATAGPVPTDADPASYQNNPASTVYRPLQVSFTALTAGNGPAGVRAAGVRAEVVPDPNGYTVTFSPNHPYANPEGFIAVPDVDLAKEYVNILETKTLFRAGISVLKTEKDMMGELLDAVT